MKGFLAAKPCPSPGWLVGSGGRPKGWGERGKEERKWECWEVPAVKPQHLSIAVTQDVFSGSDPWVGKIPWRRAWQPTPEFLPGESHGQVSPVACRP